MNNNMDNIYTLGCEAHDQSWHLLSQSGGDLCAKCCQSIWSSSSGSDSVRKELLSQLDASLRLGTKLANTLSNSQTMASGESHQFIESIVRLVYHSEPRIRDLSKNCIKNNQKSIDFLENSSLGLNLLVTQIKDQSISELVFEDILKNMSVDNLSYNESILDLMAELVSDICLATHPLKDDIDILFLRLQIEFDRVEDNRLKTSVLTLFNAFYANNETNELFALNNDFHLKSLSMVFNTFEGLNSHSNDSKLVLKSIELLKRLSKIETILKPLTTDQNLVNYLEKLLRDKRIEVKNSILIWILDLLDEETNPNEYIRRSLASTLDKRMINSLTEQLSSSPSVSILILECLLLVLDNTRKTKTQLNSLLKAVIKSLQISVNIKDNNQFLIGLMVLKKIIEKHPNSGIHLITEFDFYLILDLLETSLLTPSLFIKALEFCGDFFVLKNVPILIPTQRMRQLFDRVMANISNTVGDHSSECIDRTTGAIKLIKSFVNLINAKKRNDLSENSKDTHFLNVEKQWNCDDFDLQEFDENHDLVEVSKRTEIYEFLTFCLQQIEEIFGKTLKRLKTRRHFENNLILFEELCLCLEIIIRNDLFSAEDTNRFLVVMFSKGYVLSLLQLWFSKYPMDCESFASQLSSLLSLFLFKIQFFENQNKFDANVIQKQLIHSKEQFTDSSVSLSDLWDETNSESIDTFFAVNYYSHKFLLNDNFEMDGKYADIFLKVLNIYLQNNLSDAFESVSTVKYCLFLSSLCSSLEEQTVEALQQFFGKREDMFYAKYYTNHIKLIEWLFCELKSDKFAEFGLKTFLKDIPESQLQANYKQNISSFFSLIDRNERAVQILIDALCDSNEDNITIDVILDIIEDSDQFIDESYLHNSWQLFYERLYEKIIDIVEKLVEHIKNVISGGVMWDMEGLDNDLVAIDVVNPQSIEKISKLLTFLCRLLSNEMNVYNFETYGQHFESLFKILCELIDNHLEDNTLNVIFRFFRLCLNSSTDCETVVKPLTQYLLESKIGVISLFSRVNKDSVEEDNREDSKNRETALFLLSVVSQNRSINHFNHNFVYELDINRVLDLLNTDSKVLSESAFVLLNNSLETKFYFESLEKSEEIKVKEMRKLLHSLQNAVFRQYISLEQMNNFLRQLFNDLKAKRYELLTDLANSRWFRVIIDNYLEIEERQESPSDEQLLLFERRLQCEEDMDFEESDSQFFGTISLRQQIQPNYNNNLQKRRQIRIFREEFLNFLHLFVELDFVNTVLVEVINEVTQLLLPFLDKPEEKMSTFVLSVKDRALKLLEAIDCGVYASHLSPENRKLLTILSEKESIPNISNEHNYCITDDMITQ